MLTKKQHIKGYHFHNNGFDFGIHILSQVTYCVVIHFWVRKISNTKKCKQAFNQYNCGRKLIFYIVYTRKKSPERSTLSYQIALISYILFLLFMDALT